MELVGLEVALDEPEFEGMRRLRTLLHTAVDFIGIVH